MRHRKQTRRDLLRDSRSSPRRFRRYPYGMTLIRSLMSDKTMTIYSAGAVSSSQVKSEAFQSMATSESAAQLQYGTICSYRSSWRGLSSRVAATQCNQSPNLLCEGRSSPGDTSGTLQGTLQYSYPLGRGQATHSIRNSPCFSRRLSRRNAITAPPIMPGE
jgi:hypothetical protein